VVISLDPATAEEAAGASAAEERPAKVAPNGHRNGMVARRAARRSARQVAPGDDPSVERVVIVGNGIAGVTAADHIRRHHAQCRIDLVTEERHPFYNRTSVSRLIHARTGMQRMYLLPDSWYEERRVTTWLNTAATRIERDARRVRLGTGETLPYDRLILATGASAQAPRIPGLDAEGSFTLRTADDAMLIRAFAQDSGCRRAVVIGGGVLGLEAAESLHELGLDVAVVERAFWLAPTELDARAGGLLRHHLEALGIEAVVGTSVARVQSEGGAVSAVELEDGGHRPADLVVTCAGIVPNVKLAREAGLAVRRGVLVADTMRTSDPAVFAAGDVAEHRGRIYGLWPAAVEQAEVAAINATGTGALYSGSTVPTHLRLAGLELVSIGDRHDAAGDSEIVLHDAEAPRYRKLVLADGRIVGAVLLGEPVEAPAVLAAIREGRDVRGDLDSLRAGDWNVLNEAPFEKAVVAPLARYARKGGDERATRRAR
jgi:NAD(P)H-nitrite reductase large subunit